MPGHPTARTAVCLATAVVCLAGAPACAKKKAALTTSGSAVATVGGAPITVEEFALEWNVVRGTAKGIAPMGEAASRALKRDLLDRMIERRLALAAARKAKVAAAPEEVKQEIAEMRSGYSDDQFNEVMVDTLMTHETLERRVRERLTVDRWFQEQVFKDLAADDREVEEYWGAHRQEFDRPARVRALHIVVKTEEEIAHIRERLRAGEEFGDLARRFSTAPEAKKGGALPPYAPGELPPVFDEAFALAPGQVSGALASPYGYHLFKALEKTPAAPSTLASAAPAARLKVLETKKRAAREGWAAAARAGAAIAVHDEILDAIP